MSSWATTPVWLWKLPPSARSTRYCRPRLSTRTTRSPALSTRADRPTPLPPGGRSPRRGFGPGPLRADDEGLAGQQLAAVHDLLLVTHEPAEQAATDEDGPHDGPAPGAADHAPHLGPSAEVAQHGPGVRSVALRPRWSSGGPCACPAGTWPRSRPRPRRRRRRRRCSG